MKKILLSVVFVLLFLNINIVLWEAPLVNCTWLPWCEIQNLIDKEVLKEWLWFEVLTNIIWQAIQFVAVIAVIALIISWFLYLISGWEEEKVKKSKTWIIWSIAWVFISISAWWIIGLLNKFTIW